MAPHQERVVAEKAELQDKIDKLYAFTQGDFFKLLDEAERGRLSQQLDLMARYRDILADRIRAFTQAAA